MDAIIYTAAALRENPGRAAAGIVVLHPVQPAPRVFTRCHKYLGVCTNNEAEYHALLLAIKRAQAHGFRQVVFRSSSELMVNQLRGTYTVKAPALQRLHAAALTELRHLHSWQVEHVPSHQNTAAHQQALKALTAPPRRHLDSGSGGQDRTDDQRSVS